MTKKEPMLSKKGGMVHITEKGRSVLEKAEMLQKYEEERIFNIYVKLKHKEWPTELGELPDNWENMTESERLDISESWTEVIEMMFPKKTVARVFATRVAKRSSERFEDDWESTTRSYLSMIIENLLDIRDDNGKRRTWITEGMLYGLSLAGFIMGAIALFS